MKNEYLQSDSVPCTTSWMQSASDPEKDLIAKAAGKQKAENAMDTTSNATPEPTAPNGARHTNGHRGFPVDLAQFLESEGYGPAAIIQETLDDPVFGPRLMAQLHERYDDYESDDNDSSELWCY